MELDKKQKEHLAAICREFHLKCLVLFGSYAAGTTHKTSDVDIAVYPENGFEENAARLEQKLARIFRNPHIDLVNLKTAGPLLQKEAAFNGTLLYTRDEDTFPLFQLYAIRAYYDFAPYFHLREKTIKQRLNKFSR